MSLRTRKNRGTEYWVFTGGRGNELHLGPISDISKINPNRVLEALDYVKDRHSHYTEIEDRLISFLPPEKKDQYISKRIEELQTYETKLVSSLSDPEKQQYLSKGKKTAEDQTRHRLPKQIDLLYHIMIDIDQNSVKSNMSNNSRLYIFPRKSVFIISNSQIKKFSNMSRTGNVEQFFNELQSRGVKIMAIGFENYEQMKQRTLNPTVMISSSPKYDERIREKFYANNGEILENKFLKTFSISTHQFFTTIKNNNYMVNLSNLSSVQIKDILTR